MPFKHREGRKACLAVWVIYSADKERKMAVGQTTVYLKQTNKKKKSLRTDMSTQELDVADWFA